MASYLDKFRSSLPNTQGQQMLNLLVSKRDSGEIRTIDEFKNKLKELTAKLLASKVAPTFELLTAIAGEDISSERFNFMLDRINDDLTAAFIEVDTLDEIIATHHNLINEVGLKSIRFSLNELEARVSLYEFLNRHNKGFDDSLFNTFRGFQKESTTRSDLAAGLVLVDPRTHTPITSDQDCYIDPIGERLTLGFIDSNQAPIKEVVWLSNSNSIRGEVSASFKGSLLSNLIDNTKNTYWFAPILLSKIRPLGVPMELALNLSASQDVNYIELEPATLYPMTLVGVDYIDASNIRRSSVVSSLTITGNVRINLERITTNCLILKLTQNNYEEIQFVQKAGTDNFERAVTGEITNSIDKVSVTDTLKQVLTSDFILTDIFGLRSTAIKQVKYFEYILGFDNIRVGFSAYSDRGIFSSIKKTVSQLGQLGLTAIETRPVQMSSDTSIIPLPFTYPSRDTSEDSKFYHGVVEYWIAMQSYSVDNYLIATDFIPILPMGASRVYHEQLVFVSKSSTGLNNDQGQLIFFTQALDSDVLVYRNGTLLTFGIHWEFIDVSDSSALTIESPATNSSPMKRGIHIKETVNPLDIYTVSYTPTLSNIRTLVSNSSLQNIVDLIGDSLSSARIVAENNIVLNNLRNGQTVDHSDIYLIILMRRNSAEENFSPTVEEYMLVTGSRDQQKFVSE